jgi:peptide/nickel transport system substrate-binding protein
MKRLLAILIILLACSLIIVGCGTEVTTTTTPPTTTTTPPTTTTTPPTTPTATPKTGGTLVILGGMVTTLGDPREMGAPGKFNMVPCLENLGRLNEEGDLQPWLAESWTLDPVAKTVTVKLKQGIKFHDNTEFNAAAVKFNWELFINTHNNLTRNVASVDVLDTYTVRANLSQWDSNIDVELFHSGGKIVSPTAWQTNGEEWGKLNPVGTGPFKFVSWEPAVSIKYEKWEGYWQEGKPYLDGIQILLMDDTVARLNTFQAGEADVMTFADKASAETLEAQGNIVFRNPSGIDAAVWGLFPDVGTADNPSPFAKVEVRKAVEYAIDKQSLVDVIYHGFGSVQYQIAPYGTQYYDPNIEQRSYSVSKAKELLSAAGYPDGFDTILYGDINGTKVLEVVQPMLAEVGIRGTIESTTSQGMFQKVIGGGWGGLMWCGVQLLKDPVAGEINYFMINSPLCPSVFKSQEIDDAFAAALTATDAQTKLKAVHFSQELLFNKYVVIIPIVLDQMPSVKYPYVKGDNINVYALTIWTPEDTWLDK